MSKQDKAPASKAIQEQIMSKQGKALASKAIQERIMSKQDKASASKAIQERIMSKQDKAPALKAIQDFQQIRKDMSEIKVKQKLVKEVNVGLPSVIVEEILASLPIETIVRFRQLSKEWSCFLISAEFQNLRAKFVSPDDKTQKFLVSRPCGFWLQNFEDVLEESIYRLKHRKNDLFVDHSTLGDPLVGSIHKKKGDHDAKGSFEDKGDHKFKRGFKLSFPLRRGNVFHFLGSCNGLVLLNLEPSGDHFVLWNPCTGIYRELPRIDYYTSKRPNWIAYGFGYDPSSQDDKIFISWTWTDSSGVGEQKSRIFSLKANSWKEIPSCNHQKNLHSAGFFLHGALHWLVDDQLIAFDLEKEVFYDVPIPPPAIGCRCWLGILGGEYLCVFFQHSLGMQQYWVMMEFGVPESWVLAFDLHDARYGQVFYKCQDVLIRRFMNNYGYVCLQRGYGQLDIIDFSVKGRFGEDYFRTLLRGYLIPYTEGVTSP